MIPLNFFLQNALDVEKHYEIPFPFQISFIMHLIWKCMCASVGKQAKTNCCINRSGRNKICARERFVFVRFVFVRCLQNQICICKTDCINRSGRNKICAKQNPDLYLRYESSTLILYKELSSSIFQSL